MRASFIVIRKSQELTTILVREDKLVMINFGSSDWFNFRELKDIKGLKNNKSIKKYLQWINSKRFKRNYKETIEILENNDYEEVVKKFIKDFKKDRGNRIIRQDVEIEPNKKIEDLQ